MPRIDQFEKLNTNERKFIQLITNIDSVISLTDGTIQLVYQLERDRGINYERFKNPGISDSSFPLGQIALSYIKTTQSFMVHFDAETNAKIVLNRNIFFIDFLSIIYKGLYNKEPHNDFKEFLKELAFEATWLHYDSQTIITFWHDHYITYAHLALNKSKLEQALNTNLIMSEQYVNSYAFISSSDRTAALAKLNSFNQQLLQEFDATTDPVSPQKFYWGAGILSALTLATGWALNFPIIGFTASLFTAGGTAWFGSSYSNSHWKLKPKLEQSYLRYLHINLTQRGHGAELEGHFYKSRSKQEKVKTAVYAKLDALTKNQALKPIQIINIDSSSSSSTQKTSRINIETYSLFKTPESSSHTDYNYENLKKYYRQLTKEENKQEESKQETKSQNNRTSTYAQITYKLPQSLQKHGCLAQEGPSMAYFDFGKHLNSLEAKIFNNITQNKYGFGAKEGDFEVFKRLSNGDYALKFFDGRRVLFREEGKVAVQASDGTEKNVPNYVAYEMSSK